MALLIEQSEVSYDLNQIGRGCLLWGRHYTWKEGKAGFVTSATKEQLIVQYHPDISNVTNHFIIPVSEVEKGQWEIRWSVDMLKIQEYNGTADSGEQEEEGIEYVVGRINL